MDKFLGLIAINVILVCFYMFIAASVSFVRVDWEMMNPLNWHPVFKIIVCSCTGVVSIRWLLEDHL